MNYRAIGSLSVSTVGIGTNNFGTRLDRAQSSAVVHAALDNGITFFDTSNSYGISSRDHESDSERFLGSALGARREQAIIATKFGFPLNPEPHEAHPANLRRACEDSLRRLGTDYIDLYQLHFPDDTVTFEETLGGLQELVDQGLVREVGACSLNGEMIRSIATGTSPLKFSSMQNQYSLLWREPETDGVLDECAQRGIAILPFYPLANGLLTGKIRPGEPIPEGTRLALMDEGRKGHWLKDEFQLLLGQLLTLSTEINVPMLTLAFSWLLSHPPVSSVIAGASTPEQVQANATAVIELSDELRQQLDNITAVRE